MRKLSLSLKVDYWAALHELPSASVYEFNHGFTQYLIWQLNLFPPLFNPHESIFDLVSCFILSIKLFEQLVSAMLKSK